MTVACESTVHSSRRFWTSLSAKVVSWSDSIFLAHPIGEDMVKVVLCKRFPSGAQISKFEHRKNGQVTVFYVREAVRDHRQVLELCCVPNDLFTEIQAIVAMEDSVRREVFPSNEFTQAWAEEMLAHPEGCPVEMPSLQ